MNKFWNGKKVLITGHTGFKGSWLAFWLGLLGAEVYGYALEAETQPNLFESLQLSERTKTVFGDIRHLPHFLETLHKVQPEIIFHLAAQSLVRRSYRQPVETYSTNVIGTVNILEAARNINSVRSIVISTTDKVYENAELGRAFREDEKLGGFDPYSSSKACAELAVSAYRSSFYAEGRCLIGTARAGNVIGGGDWSEDRLLPDVFRSLIFNEQLEIRSPESIRPWQHVLEPLAGYMMLAERLYNRENRFASAWNFGSGESDAQPVIWILNKIKDIWNDPITWNLSSDTHPHEAKILKLDSTKAQNELEWQPKLILAEAVKMTAEWYLGFKNGNNLINLTADQISFYQNK